MSFISLRSPLKLNLILIHVCGEVRTKIKVQKDCFVFCLIINHFGFRERKPNSRLLFYPTSGTIFRRRLAKYTQWQFSWFASFVDFSTPCRWWGGQQPSSGLYRSKTEKGSLHATKWTRRHIPHSPCWTFWGDIPEKDNVPPKTNQPYSSKVDGEEVCVIQGVESPLFLETQVEDEKRNREKVEGYRNDKGARNYIPILWCEDKNMIFCKQDI